MVIIDSGCNGIEDSDLDDYAQRSLHQFLFNRPGFARPSLPCYTILEDLVFMFPPFHSLSFLYIPVYTRDINTIQDIILHSTTTSLTDSELEMVGIPKST